MFAPPISSSVCCVSHIVVQLAISKIQKFPSPVWRMLDS